MVGRRVGDLAAATGLTVRALHHYEEIGLLVASQRSQAGHRLYDVGDVERLYRIRMLRQLGLPLAEIARALDDPAWDLATVVRRHLDEVEQRLAASARLRNQLVRLLGSDLADAGSLDENLLALVEEMTMAEPLIQQTIPYLVYRDLEASYEHLQRVFGFEAGGLDRDEDGVAVHGELYAGSAVLWLHRETQDGALSSPQKLGASTAGVAVIVDDVDEHHRHAVERGAAIEYGPTDQPYGYREYGARDNEGGIWSFMRPLG